jgi:hypothetical protein
MPPWTSTGRSSAPTCSASVVTDAVLPERENVVAVQFHPPLTHVGPPLPGQWAPFNHERVWMRNGQYG